MKTLAKSLFGLFLVGFMVSAYSAGTAAVPVEESFSGYIEVCEGKDVYLPPGTKFVTCHGKITRVLGVVRMMEGEKSAPGGCVCPDCCGGTCVVVVSCGNEAVASVMEDNGDLCYAYLACGD